MDGGESTRRALLEHRRFMLAVARELCGEDQAEDVVQEASLRALRRPADHDGALRAWLRRVVASAAADLVRMGARRTARERAVARRVLGVDAITRLDQADLVRRIEGALRTLREPYRTVLSLRLHEDLTPAEIAERTGRSLEATRSQLRRGRDLLRADLDRAYGDRRTWSVALFALVSAPHKPLGLPSPARRAWLAAGLSGLAVFVWWTLPPTTEAAHEPVEVAARAGAADDVRGLARPAPGTRSPAGGAAETIAPPEEVRAREVPPRELRGRVTDGKGDPVAGASVHLFHAAGGLRQPLEEHARSTRGTDGEGRFRLPLGDEPVYVVAATAEALSLEVLEVLPGAETLPEVELVLTPSSTMSFTVLSASGEPVPFAEVELLGLRVEGRSPRRTSAATAYHIDLPVRVTAGPDGAGEVRRRTAGAHMLWARAEGHPEGIARVEPGGKNGVLRLEDNRDQLVLAVLGDRPLEGVRVELVPADGDAPRVGHTAANGLCALRGLPGWKAFAVKMTRSDLRPYVSPPLRNGRLRAEMELARTRRARLVDATGEAVARAPLEVWAPSVRDRLEAAGFSAETSAELTGQRLTTDGDGRIALPASSEPLALRVEAADGRAPATLFVPPGDGELELRLPAPGTRVRVTGHVRDGDRPIAAFRARAIRPERAGGAAWVDFERPDGTFELEVDGGPGFALEVAADGHTSALVFDVSAERPLDVRLHRTREVELRVVDAAGAPLGPVTLHCTTPDGEPVLLPRVGGGAASTFALNGRGRARLPAVPERELRLTFVTAHYREPHVLDLPARGGKHELGLPVRLGQSRRLLRVRALRERRAGIEIQVSVLDAQGRACMQAAIRWGRNACRIESPSLPPAVRRPAGGLPRRSDLRGWISPVDPLRTAQRDPLQAELDLPIPEGEEVVVELAASGFRRRVRVPPDRTEPIVWRADGP